MRTILDYGGIGCKSWGAHFRITHGLRAADLGADVPSACIIAERLQYRPEGSVRGDRPGS